VSLLMGDGYETEWSTPGINIIITLTTHVLTFASALESVSYMVCSEYGAHPEFITHPKRLPPNPNPNPNPNPAQSHGILAW